MASTHQHLRLRLVFSGQCLPGHDPQAVRSAVAAALRLSSRHSERLFSGKHIVLKQQVDAAYAAKQIARFAAMGAVLSTESAQPIPSPQPAPVQATRLVPPEWRWPSDRRTWGAMAALGLLLVAVVGVVGWNSPDAERAAPLVSSGVPPAPARVAVTAVPALRPLSYLVADEDLPRQLTAQAAQDYRQQYWPAVWHKAFAVAASGAHVWVVGAQSPAQARQLVIKQCSLSQQAALGVCRVVDVDGEPQD